MSQESRASDLLAPVVAVAAIAACAWIGRGTWFYSDDWNIYAYYHRGNLLEPFNGHLSLVPAGLYQLLFRTVGVDSYLPYRICGLGALSVLAFQLVRFTRTRLADFRVGRSDVAPWMATLVVGSILLNPSGSMVLLFPFLMNFTLPIAALVAAWWHLDRDSDRNDVAASAWLCLALATSGLGLMAMAALGAELVISRAPLKRFLIMAPGPVLWAVWFVTHRDANDVSTDLMAVASYGARMYLGATTSLAAGWKPGGIALAALFVAFTALAGLRWRSLDARSIGALCAPLTFIGFTALTRLDIVPHIEPDELRYSWTIAAFLVLSVVVMLRPRQPFTRALPNWVLPSAGAMAAVVIAIGGARLVPTLVNWNKQVSSARPGLTSVLFATEAVGADRIDSDLVIPLSYVPVTAGAYLEAAKAVGSPIADVRSSELGGEADSRSTGDRILVTQLPIKVVTDKPPHIEDSTCLSLAVSPATGALRVPPGSVIELSGTPTAPAGPESAVEASGGSDSSDLLLQRMGPPGDPQAIRLPSQSTSWLVIPPDAETSARGELDYSVTVPVGTSASVCDG